MPIVWIIVGLLVLFALLLLTKAIKIVPEYQRLVVFRSDACMPHADRASWS
jgi:regulator of protease activity HflC (stomatin/prohibitin superfamily)